MKEVSGSGLPAVAWRNIMVKATSDAISIKKPNYLIPNPDKSNDSKLTDFIENLRPPESGDNRKYGQIRRFIATTPARSGSDAIPVPPARIPKKDSSTRKMTPAKGDKAKTNQLPLPPQEQQSQNINTLIRTVISN